MDRATAQGRTAGTVYSSRASLRTTDWGTTEVGSAYLFEKYRGKAEGGVKGDDNEMPRFSDITDNNACDSGACYTNNNHYKPNES
jgi:hypothetical protein